MFASPRRARLTAAMLLFLSCAASAQGSPAPAPAGKKTPPLDIRPFVQEVDRNHDGCMSAQEWKAAGAPQSAYNMLKDERGCVTEARMNATAPPDGIDLNHDGKVTLAEMKAFDKKGPPRPKAGAVPPPLPASR